MNLINHKLGADRVEFPALSSVVGYDNMSRLATNGTITYEGGNNLKARYSGKWWGVLADYAPGYADKTMLLWSYSMSNGLSALASTKAAVVGGCTNGYIIEGGGPPTPEFGAVSLYGARLPASGNTSVDYSNPNEIKRLLGDDPNETLYSDHMRGVSSWARASANYSVTIHHDDPIGVAGMHSLGAQFSESMVEGFTKHGAGSYLTYMRGRYANDAAYLADRLNALNYPDDYRVHQSKKVREFFSKHWGPRAKSLGMYTSGNVYCPWPSEAAAQCHVVSDLFDFAMFENPWWMYNHDFNAGNYRTQRATAENVSDATTLLNAFASLSAQFSYFQGVRRRSVVAIYPMMGWWPSPSAGDGSAPSTAAYTEPLRIRALMRAQMAWAWAWGIIPVFPSGFYDGIFDVAPSPEYTAYTGNNKPLWYGDPLHYADLYSFVAAHADLFDDFVAAPTVALAAPCFGPAINFKRYDGAYNLADTQVWVNSYLRPLVSARVPFIIAPLGGPARQIPLSDYDLSKPKAVIKMANDATFTANSAPIPTGTNVTDYTAVNWGALSGYAPVAVSGETDATRPVLCMPRVKKDNSAIALHFVNTNMCDYAANSGNGAANARQSGVVATVSYSFLHARPKHAQYYEPGRSGPRPVRMVLTDAGVQLSLPPLAEWGIVTLEF